MGYNPWCCKRVGHNLGTKQQQANILCLCKSLLGGVPDGPVVRALGFQCRGSWVCSLVGKLRSCKMYGMAKKKKISYIFHLEPAQAASLPLGPHPGMPPLSTLLAYLSHHPPPKLLDANIHSPEKGLEEFLLFPSLPGDLGSLSLPSLWSPPGCHG